MGGERRRAYLLLHLVVLAWGLTGPLGRLIDLDAIPLVWFRMGLGTIGLVAYLWFARDIAPLGSKGRRIAVAVGFLVAIHWVLFFASIKASTVSVALVCLASGAFMAAFLEPILYRRPIHRLELLLGTVAMAGIAVVYGFEYEHHQRGILLGIASAAVGALFTSINGRLVQQYDSRALSIWELGGGCAFLTPYMLLSSGIPTPPAALDWVYLLLLSWLCTSFAFMASVAVMRQISPFTVLLTTNLEPIYGIMLALVIFGDDERMSIGFYAGAGLVLVAIAIDAWTKRSIIQALKEES